MLSLTLCMLGQSREGLIQLEFKNYVTKETLGEVDAEGKTVDGKKVGPWIYFMIYDRDILYYKGIYIDGKKEGVWNNYALLPPMGYTNNFDLVRSTENWKNGAPSSIGPGTAAFCNVTLADTATRGWRMSVTAPDWS